MKIHLATLLKQQLAYWKQRGKIKWVTLGDENSRFFHSMASNQKRRNQVATLSDDNGNPVSDHSEKSEILLQAYKEILGQTETNTTLPNLQQLIHVNEDLSFLEAPFTHKENDDVVKDFPNNKSP
jgi:hypothetical protein